MALTIQNPKGVGITTWFPSNNDLIYTISSDQSAVTGFYYIIDVFVDGVKVVTLRKYPIQGVATMLNVKDIVNTYISSSFLMTILGGQVIWTTNSNVNENNEFVSFYIVVREHYNGEDYDEVTTLPMYAWDSHAQFPFEKNGTFRYFREFTFDTLSNIYKGREMGYHQTISDTPNDMIEFGMKPRYLKQKYFPYAYKMARGDKRAMTLFCGSTLARNDEVTCLIAYGFDSEGYYMKKAVKTITPTTDNANRHWVNFIYNGGNETGWTFTIKENDETTFSNMNDCTYIYYCFGKTYNATKVPENDGVSQGILVKVCDVPESYSVLYKSFEGGWRHIQLNRRAVETTDIKTITKQNVNPSSAYWQASSRLVTAVSVQAQGRRTFNTDWVSEEINEEIQDMLISPCLYIQHYINGTVEFFPVTLTDAEYITKQINDVNLFNYQLNFIESYEKNTLLR